MLNLAISRRVKYSLTYAQTTPSTLALFAKLNYFLWE